jgi:hypothetical protein
MKKIPQNATQPIFLQINAYITFTVEKSSTYLWPLCIVFFKETAQSDESPNRRNIAQKAKHRPI